MLVLSFEHQSRAQGSTMSIIESFLVLGRLLARAKQSAPSGGNGRRVICADRQTRLTTAPRERPGWLLASESTPRGDILALHPVHRSRLTACRRGSAAPPTMVLEENIRVSGVSLPSLRGGLGSWRLHSSTAPQLAGGSAPQSAICLPPP